MDNKLNKTIKPDEQKKDQEVKEKVEEPIMEENKKEIKLERFNEIEEKTADAFNSGDIERGLLLNELTLARNLEQKGFKKKEFSVCYVAFKKDADVVKRAGIYNGSLLSAEQAEDVLLAEDFKNPDVLAVPRSSVFAASFK